MGLSLSKKIKLIMSRFNVTVIVYSVYQNITYPKTYKGIYLKDSIKVGEGKIDAHHFYFKRSFGKFQEVNEVSLNNIIDVGGKRLVQLVQLGEDFFLPLVPYEKRLLYYLKVPVMDDKGQQVYQQNFEEVPMVISGAIVKDKEGKPVMEKRALKPEPVYETQEYVFNTMAEVESKTGVTRIPAMLPQENYANRVHSQAEHLRMSSRYASKDFWSKYGNVIMLIVAFMGIAIIMKLNYDGFLASSAQLSGSNQAVANAVLELVKHNVTIAR
jgi:hypothetical protein